jgi:DNA polymerase-3 subunit alpha
MSYIDTLLTFHRDASVTAPQDSLFGSKLSALPTLTLPSSDRVTSPTDKLMWEKELLGIYVSGHPLDSYAPKISKTKLTISAIREEPKPGLPVVLAVMVADVRSILTKNGEKMAFIRIEDKTGTIESVMFPKLYKEHAGLLSPGTCVLVKGTVSNRNNELSLALENMKAL